MDFLNQDQNSKSDMKSMIPKPFDVPDRNSRNFGILPEISQSLEQTQTNLVSILVAPSGSQPSSGNPSQQKLKEDAF